MVRYKSEMCGENSAGGRSKGKDHNREITILLFQDAKMQTRQAAGKKKRNREEQKNRKTRGQTRMRAVVCSEIQDHRQIPASKSHCSSTRPHSHSRKGRRGSFQICGLIPQALNDSHNTLIHWAIWKLFQILNCLSKVQGHLQLFRN